MEENKKPYAPSKEGWQEMANLIINLLKKERLFAANKQDKLNAGENIKIENNRISAQVPEDVATQSWVESKDYLTEHQDLSDYALKTDLPEDYVESEEIIGDAEEEDLNFLKTDLSNITESGIQLLQNLLQSSVDSITYAEALAILTAKTEES